MKNSKTVYIRTKIRHFQSLGVPIFFKIDFSYELIGSAEGALFDFIGLKIHIGMKF